MWMGVDMAAAHGLLKINGHLRPGAVFIKQQRLPIALLVMKQPPPPPPPPSYPSLTSIYFLVPVLGRRFLPAFKPAATDGSVWAYLPRYWAELRRTDPDPVTKGPWGRSTRFCSLYLLIPPPPLPPPFATASLVSQSVIHAVGRFIFFFTLKCATYPGKEARGQLGHGARLPQCCCQTLQLVQLVSLSPDACFSTFALRAGGGAIRLSPCVPLPQTSTSHVSGVIDYPRFGGQSCLTVTP